MSWARMGICGGILYAGCYVLCGCSGPSSPADERLSVTVSIPPQRFFVQRIAGDRVRVSVMVGAGESPATYEPKPSQLRGLSESAVYVRIGVPFEDAWMARLAPMMADGEIVHVADGQAMLTISASHGDHHHEHGVDPHTWLSPRLAAEQAEVVCETLCRLDPAAAGAYRATLAVLVGEIQGLDEELAGRLSAVKGGRFLVFHPSWGYFAHEYGLEQVPIEVGGQEPSAQELAALVRRAEEMDIRVVFVQPEFDTSKAETVAGALGGGIVRVSPLAEDWIENLRGMGRSLEEVLRP